MEVNTVIWSQPSPPRPQLCSPWQRGAAGLLSLGPLSAAMIGAPAVAETKPMAPATAQRTTIRNATASRLVGTWVLTDNDNVPFNLLVRADGRSMTVIGKRHPDLGSPQRKSRDQLVETGRWRPWGNGIRSDYNDGWTDTIQLGPAGPVQWSWKPGASLNGAPTNHGKAVLLTSPVMAWVGAYKLEPTQPEKPAYVAVLTSSGLAFNNIDRVSEGSWSLHSDGSVLIKWTSGWRTAINASGADAPGPNQALTVQHWRPGVNLTAPARARRGGYRL